MALKAIERMGEIPPDILSGDRLPSLRPVVIQPTENSVPAFTGDA